MSQRAASKSSFLSARHAADIRKMARIARIEGITLNVHGVTIGPANGILQLQDHEVTNATHDGHAPSTESGEDVCIKPSKRQQKRAQRLADYNEAKRAAACGARWLPLAQVLLRRSRAKLRSDVWTGWMRSKLTVHERMRAFLRKACAHYARKHALTLATSAAEDLDVFGPSSFLDSNEANGQEDADLQAAIAASLAEMPPDDPGANRARHAPPSKGGKKSRGRGSSRPLQPANRG